MISIGMDKARLMTDEEMMRHFGILDRDYTIDEALAILNHNAVVRITRGQLEAEVSRGTTDLHDWFDSQ